MTTAGIRRLQSWQQIRTVEGIEQSVPLGPRGKRLVDRSVASGARAAFAVALSAVVLLDETFRWLRVPPGKNEGWRRSEWREFVELAEALRELSRVSPSVQWSEFDKVGTPLLVPLGRSRLPVDGGSTYVASAHAAVLAVLRDAAHRVVAAMHDAGCLRVGESQSDAVARLGAAGWKALRGALVELVGWAEGAAPLQWPNWSGIEQVLTAELRKVGEDPDDQLRDLLDSMSNQEVAELGARFEPAGARPVFGVRAVDSNTRAAERVVGEPEGDATAAAVAARFRGDPRAEAMLKRLSTGIALTSVLVGVARGLDGTKEDAIKKVLQQLERCDAVRRCGSGKSKRGTYELTEFGKRLFEALRQ
ncbi:MAG: hypothetical protein ACK52I_11765 [Pseudomonadota bacterium]|jgi:hypothetical protein